MKKASATKSPSPSELNERVQDVATIRSPLKADNKWTAVRLVRLPHKVGLPLGCDGSGCGCESPR
jgi:hypothetical protein